MGRRWLAGRGVRARRARERSVVVMPAGEVREPVLQVAVASAPPVEPQGVASRPRRIRPTIDARQA